MFFNAIEGKLKIENASFDYIQFGAGKKNLIMIQGLNTNGIKGASLSLAYMYRMFAKEYTVYLFDRRDEVYEGITVKELGERFIEEYFKDADSLGISRASVHPKATENIDSIINIVKKLEDNGYAYN